MNQDLVPARILQKVLTEWYWVVLAAILGGILGFCLTFLRAPRYEASAALSIGFDYARVNEMDDPVKSYVILRIRDLLLSDEVIQRAYEALDRPGRPADSPGDPQELRDQIRLAEAGGRWELVGWAGSPDEAAAIANSWAESALISLNETMLHTLRAGELQTAIYRIGCKLVEDPSGSGDAIWTCQNADGSVDPDQLPDALLDEIRKSRGLLPGMTFSVLQRAEPSTTPVLWGRGVLILAGTLLGMWISIIVITVWSRAGGKPTSPGSGGQAKDE